MRARDEFMKRYGCGSKLLTFFNVVLCVSCCWTLFCKVIMFIIPGNGAIVQLFGVLYSYCVVTEVLYIPWMFGIVLIFWITKMISKNITKRMLVINLAMTCLSVAYVIARLLWWRYAVFSQPLHP